MVFYSTQKEMEREKLFWKLNFENPVKQLTHVINVSCHYLLSNTPVSEKSMTSITNR